MKGKKEEREKQKKDHPEKYACAQVIWNLRKRHMRTDVPLKYIFCLSCCYQPDCEHSLCRKGKPSEEPTWYVGGPPLSFLPVPCPDPERCYGSEQCSECNGACYGHYQKLDELWKYTCEVGDVKCCLPSEVILAEYDKHRKETISTHEILDDNCVQDLAKQTLLSPEEVTMWLSHLNTIAENRKKGAEKAAKTRRARKEASRKLIDLPNGDDSEVCDVCKLEDTAEEGEEIVPWVCCDGCSQWSHIVCVGIETELEIPNHWQCVKCSEKWE